MVFRQSNCPQDCFSRKHEAAPTPYCVGHFQTCADNRIHLEIQWIPRTQIERADFISRLIDVDDWQLTRSCFGVLENLWGAHILDCFANYYNKKIDRYFSRFWNQGCKGVDLLLSCSAGRLNSEGTSLFACMAKATIVVPFRQILDGSLKIIRTFCRMA